MLHRLSCFATVFLVLAKGERVHVGEVLGFERTLPQHMVLPNR
jgi:hypothetical protein